MLCVSPRSDLVLRRLFNVFDTFALYREVIVRAGRARGTLLEFPCCACVGREECA